MVLGNFCCLSAKIKHSHVMKKDLSYIYWNWQIKNMINTIINNKVICDDNVININTEKLYREAEDFFFYFHKEKRAVKKLNEALKLTPAHTKCLKLRGDIYYSLGKIQNALDDYATAAALKPDDAVLLASLASLNEISGNYKVALAFCDEALKKLNTCSNLLYSQLFELKINILIKLQRYSEAESCLNYIKRRFSPDTLYNFSSNHFDYLKKKLELKEKINNLSLKIV